MAKLYMFGQNVGVNFWHSGQRERTPAICFPQDVQYTCFSLCGATTAGFPSLRVILRSGSGQVNAKALLRKVQAAEEGLETGALRDHSLALDCDALHFKVAAEEQRP